MTCVYRILRKPYSANPLDGEGSFRYGGRWSSVGTRVAYTSAFLSLAMLEYFVHLDADDLPGDLVLVRAEIPDSIPGKTIGVEQLPRDWRQTPAPPELAKFGDNFIHDADPAILVVPSAIAPEESNWLINPLHAAFPKIQVHPPEPFSYDPRFSKTVP